MIAKLTLYRLSLRRGGEGIGTRNDNGRSPGRTRLIHLRRPFNRQRAWRSHQRVQTALPPTICLRGIENPKRLRACNQQATVRRESFEKIKVGPRRPVVVVGGHAPKVLLQSLAPSARNGQEQVAALVPKADKPSLAPREHRFEIWRRDDHVTGPTVLLDLQHIRMVLCAVRGRRRRWAEQDGLHFGRD